MSSLPLLPPSVLLIRYFHLGKAVNPPERTNSNPSNENSFLKAPIRRDSIHRRVSTSADQTTLDLEDELFTPTVKLSESSFLYQKWYSESRQSLLSKHGAYDTDSSYSNLSLSLEHSFLRSPSNTTTEHPLSESMIADIAGDIPSVEESLLCSEDINDLDDDAYSYPLFLVVH